MAKKTRLQMDLAGDLPTYQPGDKITVGGRHAVFVSYGNPFNDSYATVTDDFNQKPRYVKRHLIREATI